MDGISSYMGMQAQQLQQTVSLSILDMAMNQGAAFATEMIEQMPDVAATVPVSEGEVGFNLDVRA